MTVCQGCDQHGRKVRLTYEEFVTLEAELKAAQKTNNWQGLKAKLTSFGWGSLRTIPQLKAKALILLGREEPA